MARCKYVVVKITQSNKQLLVDLVALKLMSSVQLEGSIILARHRVNRVPLRKILREEIKRG